MLASDPDWLLLADGDSIGAVLRPQAFAESRRAAAADGAQAGPASVPAGANAADAAVREALPFAIVSLHATLREALRCLDRAQTPIGLVERAMLHDPMRSAVSSSDGHVGGGGRLPGLSSLSGPAYFEYLRNCGLRFSRNACTPSRDSSVS